MSIVALHLDPRAIILIEDVQVMDMPGRHVCPQTTSNLVGFQIQYCACLDWCWILVEDLHTSMAYASPQVVVDNEHF